MLEIKKYMIMPRWKSHQHIFLWNTFIHQGKVISISSVANIIWIKAAPLFLVGHYHILHMATFETKRSLINKKVPQKQPHKMKHRKDVLQEGIQFQIWINFHDGIIFSGSWHTKQHLKPLCRIVTFLQKSLCRKSLPYTGSALLGLSFDSFLGNG